MSQDYNLPGAIPREPKGVIRRVGLEQAEHPGRPLTAFLRPRKHSERSYDDGQASLVYIHQRSVEGPSRPHRSGKNACIGPATGG